MIKLTIKEITEAFRSTGIIPTPNTTLRRKQNGTCCGCPIAAVIVNRSGLDVEGWFKQSKPHIKLDQAFKELGLNNLEAGGIMDGFDGIVTERDMDLTPVELGEYYRLGIKARTLIALAGDNLN